jgi:chromosome segregation ATPase
MGMFGWNESKLARIAELEEQIRALQEIRESLLHEVERIQGEFMVMRGIVDESREGVEQHRNIADQLEKERDDLKVQLETRTNQVGFLKNRMANLTHDIIAGLTTIQVRKSITRALVDLDKLDSK